MTLAIRLEQIELVGFHGVLDEERRNGQRFVVDVELDLRSDRAGVSDDLEDTVDYRSVVACVQTVSDGRAYQLLEAFATAVADELFGAFPVSRVRVSVRKPDLVLDPPVGAAVVVAEHSSDAV
jgi:dihydroneopterin aldolase